MKDSKTIIKERLASLPYKIQDAIMSKEFNETLRALAKKYKIHFDKWELLENDILLVLISIKKPEELLSTLNKLGLDSGQSEKLLGDLIEHVFKPMRKLLKESLDEDESEAQESADDPRAPENKILQKSKEDLRRGVGLDKAFNIGDLPEIDDPYREKIEL